MACASPYLSLVGVEDTFKIFHFRVFESAVGRDLGREKKRRDKSETTTTTRARDGRSPTRDAIASKSSLWGWRRARDRKRVLKERERKKNKEVRYVRVDIIR